MDGLNPETLVLKKRIKEKNFEMVTLGTTDKKFEVYFEEDYTGKGIENKVKLYWKGLIPYFLSVDQKQELVKIVQDFLVKNVYGK